ncbi:unnamed protein product [Closterium sp. Naga37s-1]|nr:unnamed protein product [Closterium sp. Naga37s-1]
MTLSAPAISAPALLRTLALAPRVTALSLDANAVDFYDDEFLSRLLSARPHLTRLSIAPPRFTGTPNFQLGTKSLENFLRIASSRLQELSLRECLGHTTKLPASVASLSSLRVFRLSSKVLRSLPDEMCQLPALQELYLNCPLLRQLPETFGRLTRLEHLSFTDCKEMRRLPDSLGDLSSLTSLHVDGSWQVDRFPPRVDALQQMRRLELRNFTGASLPEACEKWEKIEQITLVSCSNMLAFQLASVHALTRLTISGACGNLRSLPPNLPLASALRHLRINYLNSEIPLEPLSQLVSLERLEVFAVDRLERFPEALFALPSLAYVNLSNIYSSALLPSDLGHLTNLRSLSLRGTWFCFPRSLSRLAPCLRSLKLDYSGNSSPDTAIHRALTSFLTDLTSLTDLHLHNIHLPSSSPACARLPALRTLRIECDSGFSTDVSLPENLGQLAALEWLELRGCFLQDGLPQSFCDLSYLHRLFLSSETLEHLPGAISKLSRLEELTLDRCYRLESLPPGFGGLRALKKLSVRGGLRNRNSLPDTLGSLSSLEEVSLAYCPHALSLPPSFCLLPRLRTLSLTSCDDLTTLPSNFGSLCSLQRLSIGSCKKFHHLPDSFSNLPSLTLLSISDCPEFSSLPETFGLLPRLTFIKIVECNSFTHLPSSSSLSALRVACFSHCKHLHSLPSTLGRLPRFEVLQLRECEALTSLPESLREARVLRHVDVYGSGVSEKGVVEVGVCGKQVHVVWGRMGKAENVGTKGKRRKRR